MKKRLTALLLCALTLLALTACGEQEKAVDGYELYYAAALEDAGGADAIGVSTVALTGESELSTGELAERLLGELLHEPLDPALRSPIPEGTKLQSVTISGRRAQVDFSAQYGRLSGVDLSVADYCVTLTLTQLEGVNAVSITANGRELPYRRTQMLLAADTLLSSREDTLRPITVSLYFLDTQTGALRAQQQTLSLYEGQTRVNALLEAMLLGPESDDTLLGLLPKDFSVLSSRIEEETCYLNLPSDVSLPAEEQAQRQMFDALVRSLCSLSGVRQVQILVDGESVQTLGTLSVAQPLAPAQ